MCLKCKFCKTSDLGVISKEVKISPVRMTDGKIVAALQEPTLETIYEVNYCFTCEKQITEKDLTDKELCTVCGKEVSEVADGMCPDCKAKADEFAGMSKEELIVAFLKKEMEKKPSRSRSRAKTTTQAAPTTENVDVKSEEAAQTPTGQVAAETTVQPTVQTNPVQTEEVKQPVEKPKAEPAPVVENQVQDAHVVLEEKVATTPEPTTVNAVNNVAQEFVPDVAITQQEVNTSVPVPNAEDDIMNALNGLENFNIEDAPF